MNKDLKKMQKELDDSIENFKKMIGDSTSNESSNCESKDDTKNRLDTSKLDDIANSMSARADAFRKMSDDASKLLEQTKLHNEKSKERSYKLRLYFTLAMGLFVIVYALIQTSKIAD